MFHVSRLPCAVAVTCCLILGAQRGAGQQQHADRDETGYVLAAEDTIWVRVPDAEEFAAEKTPYRIDKEGFVNLPMVGRCRAAGLSSTQLETELTQRLKGYYLSPRVAVSISERHTEPVSVLGAVTNAGVQRSDGRDTLVEMLSRAGGLRADAGRTVTITRQLRYGRVPLPEAKEDPTGEFSIAELNLAPIMSGERPAANILLEPHDVVTVSRADMIYVLGEVARSGGFIINGKTDISVLKALSMAGGLSRTASPGHARILRRSSGTTARQDIPINLSKVMKNGATDVELRPEDILYVPGDLTKKIASRSIEAAIAVGSNIAIWGVIQ